jgi:urease beta subunit
MRRWPMMLAALALAAPAAAQEWRMAPEYDVLLTSFEIQPTTIRLKADEAVRLRFVNNSEQPHRFSAAAFFRRAQLRDRDRDLARGGALRLAPLSDRTIALVPKAGRYKVSGDNVFRRVLGMTATIVVE